MTIAQNLQRLSDADVRDIFIEIAAQQRTVAGAITKRAQQLKTQDSRCVSIAGRIFANSARCENWAESCEPTCVHHRIMQTERAILLGAVFGHRS